MRVYEAKISYTLIEDEEKQMLNTPERVAEYLKSAFDEDPVQESFYVILLNRKMKPLGRVRITLGISTNNLIHPREVFRELY